jgi:hypothetical protein
MIIGDLYFFAASRHAEMADDETTLTAGIAYLFAFACSRRSMRALPVTTPGLTVVGMVDATVDICTDDTPADWRNAAERMPSAEAAIATTATRVRIVIAPVAVRILAGRLRLIFVGRV